jgi:hypothetical protein
MLDGVPAANNLQAGTGSTDFIINGIYTIRKKLGFNAEAIGRINTFNNLQHKFGNRINIGLQAFYWFNVHGYSLLPHAGFAYEYTRQWIVTSQARSSGIPMGKFSWRI